MPELPEPIRGKSFCGLALAFLGTPLGTPEDGESTLAPLRAVDGLLGDTLDVVPIRSPRSLRIRPTRCPGSAPDWSSGWTRTSSLRRPRSWVHGAVSEPDNLFLLGVPAVSELVPVIEMFVGRISAAVAGVSRGRTLLNFLETGEDPRCGGATRPATGS